MLLAITMVASKYTLYHPAVLFSAVWAISSFFYLLGAPSWDEICTWKTLAYIVLSNCWCVLCMLFTSRLSLKRKRYTELPESATVDICKHKMLLTIFYIVSTVMLFRKITDLASLASVYNTSTNMLYLARMAEINGSGYGRLNITIMRFNIVIGILAAAETIEAAFARRKVSKFNYFILVYAAVFSVLRGSRNDMMYLLGAYLFILLYYSYKRCVNKRKACKRTIKILVVFLLVIAVIWAVSGIAFDRVGESAVKSALGYVGGPLAGFNYLIEHPGFIKRGMFGEHTFDSIYATLNFFGLVDVSSRSVYLPYTKSSKFSINVYSMYGRFFADFGVLGSVILSTVFGVFYGALYAHLRDNKNTKKERSVVLLNSLFMYPLLMCFFEEKFFSSINNSVIVLIYLYLLNWIVNSKLAKGKYVFGKARG